VNRASATDEKSTHPWHIAASLAGWLVPGLGHWLIGEKHRAVILGVAIAGLWLGGALVGGISVFDAKEHKMWYLGQMLIAPSIAMEYAHSKMLARGGEPMPDDSSTAFSPSYARTNEQGLLYTALAGLLNLLAIIDVLYRDPVKSRRYQREPMPAGGEVGG